MGKISLRIDTFIKTVKFTVYGLHDMLISSNEMALVVRNMYPGNGKDLSYGKSFYWGNPTGREWAVSYTHLMRMAPWLSGDGE